MKLSGRVAYVSGAGSGLGRAMATIFAAHGARVVANDLREDAVGETVAALEGTDHMVAPGDVADSARVNEIFADVKRHYGRLDILVNNAGVDRTPDDGWDKLLAGELQILHMSDTGWQRMLDIHLNGAFFACRAGVPLMQINGQGSIINISSIAGLAGMGQAHYATCKAGLLGLTRSLARDLGPHNIRVNAICPGAIDTPMTKAVPDAMMKPLIRATPLRRLGVADDIANAALYLASDDSGFVTGQYLSPNGGIHIA
jgi:3-oxoacyl-[acyl-carrier protein] reductase